MIDYYEPDMVAANDYYPFGMLSRVMGASDKYKFGFNEKENDGEVKGRGNQQDYGERTYDPRLGRLLSVDPLTKDYPEQTPYQFASNRPIDGVDWLGLQWKPANLPPLSGSGGYRYISPVEVMARNTGIRIREGTRLYEEQQARETYRRETRQGTRETMNRLRVAVSQYQSNALASAQTTFGGDRSLTLTQNKSNGSAFEKEVHQALLKNPGYKGVVRQVTFSIESNAGVKVRVRVDNVGVRNDGSLDLVEAKFSVYEITQGNITRTLTLNQKEFFSIIVNGDVASIKFFGGPAKSAQIGYLNGTDVTGKINQINIVVSNNSNGNSTTSSGGTTNTNSTPPPATDNNSNSQKQ